MSENIHALEERAQEEGRLFSPSAGRNKAVIAKVLGDILPQKARVLEIASGTGEHGMAALELRPDLQWQFSDIDAASRRSQAAWISHRSYDLAAPLNLDVCDKAWTGTLKHYDVIFCANMIHIAPIEALIGLAAGATDVLAPKGAVCLYGPFLEGEKSAPSNRSFDETLKKQNSAWGVRELEFVKHIFAKQGFNAVSRYEMPKNNLFLRISRPLL